MEKEIPRGEEDKNVTSMLAFDSQPLVINKPFIIALALIFIIITVILVVNSFSLESAKQDTLDLSKFSTQSPQGQVEGVANGPEKSADASSARPTSAIPPKPTSAPTKEPSATTAPTSTPTQTPTPTSNPAPASTSTPTPTNTITPTTSPTPTETPTLTPTETPTPIPT